MKELKKGKKNKDIIASREDLRCCGTPVIIIIIRRIIRGPTGLCRGIH